MQDLLGIEASATSLTLSQVACRAALIYIGGLALVRLGKSRFLGRASAMDVLVGVMLGAILAKGIVGETSLWAALAASAVLIALHWVGSWLACRSHRIGEV